KTPMGIAGQARPRSAARRLGARPMESEVYSDCGLIESVFFWVAKRESELISLFTYKGRIFYERF
ncbi:MAG: hypothetical protein ABF649_14630, partial [Bacillus sp. (in: firmicutes)]